MKKIVALVLSLVMVLGLATTAFAAVTFDNLYFKDVTTGEVVAHDTLTAVKAVPVKYDAVTGTATAGVVAHYTMNGEMFVEVATLADADYVAYVDADCKIVKFYLDKVTNVNYYEGVAFADFGKKCGQVDYTTDEDAAYYTIKGDGAFCVYETSKTGALQVMVGGKLVAVTPVSTTKVAHTAVTESKDGKFTKVYCSACGVQAVEAPNYMSIPKGADVVVGNWYWTTTTAAAGETVESAKTFDAGIAMYVGMSVMAAAGSAVVLKKKD